MSSSTDPQTFDVRDRWAELRTDRLARHTKVLADTRLALDKTTAALHALGVETGWWITDEVRSTNPSTATLSNLTSTLVAVGHGLTVHLQIAHLHQHPETAAVLITWCAVRAGDAYQGTTCCTFAPARCTYRPAATTAPTLTPERTATTAPPRRRARCNVLAHAGRSCANRSDDPAGHANTMVAMNRPCHVGASDHPRPRALEEVIA